MAVFRDNELRFSPPVNPRQQGETITVMKSFTITENIAANDQVELGALPAGCRLVSLRIQRTNTNPSTVLDWGILTGEYLDDDGRDLPSGNRVIANNAESALEVDAGVLELIEQGTDDHVTRGIGFETRGALTGANGGTVHVIYQYMAVGNA